MAHAADLVAPIDRGIDLHDGVLYVTDTYNSKVKRVFPATRGATTLLGTGSPGHKDGPGSTAEFDEPAGISVADGKLYIADTNNHAIRTADLASLEVTTLVLTPHIRCAFTHLHDERILPHL